MSEGRLPRLYPSMSLADIFPPRTALSLKTLASTMRWVEHYDDFRVDAVTGSVLSMRGTLPVVCHEHTCLPSIRRFQELAGIPCGEGVMTYRSEEEAAAKVAVLARQGYRIAYSYPPAPLIGAQCELVLPVSRYDWLNDKSNIVCLCDPAWLPASVQLPPDRLGELGAVLPGCAVFVKLCHPGVSGGGSDVYHCPDASVRANLESWLAQRPGNWTGLRVEEEIELRDCWCVNIGVTETAEHYLGAAIQLFSAPARQCGSLIDPSRQPSQQSVQVALEIARRARGAGFVGVCGFDIGETPQGRPYVFDLNFRFVACTEQVLFHEAVTRRIGARVSRSWGAVLSQPIEIALERLESFAASGRFVPFRLYAQTEAEGDRTRIGGILAGHDADELSELAAHLSARMEGLV